jgi:hypothetical protein
MQTDDFVKLSGMKYAYPRVPGLGDGRPQYLQRCGYTPDALDPSADPEDARDKQ